MTKTAAVAAPDRDFVKTYTGNATRSIQSPMLFTRLPANTRRKSRLRQTELSPSVSDAIELTRHAPAPARAESGGEVGLRGAGVRGAALGLFPLFLAPERGEVEEVVRATQHLGAARVDGIGVEHRVAIEQEHAVTGLLRRSLPHPSQIMLLKLVQRAVIPHHRSDRCVDGHVVVVVEVATERRALRKRPTLLGLVALNLAERTARAADEIGLSLVE